MKNSKPKSTTRQHAFLEVTRKEVLWAGLLFGLITLIPASVFWKGLPCSDDTLTHFYRVIQIDLNLKNGAPFLLWGSDFLRGYGYNVLAFYAPLSYGLVEAIHLLGFDFDVAMQIANVLVLWLTGWGAYLFARKFLTPVGAFVAGLAYLFAPYLLYDAVQRGTLPETLALALAPWALAASLQAIDNPNVRNIGRAVLSFVLLILSHNIVPFFAIGLLVLFAIFSPTSSWRSFGNVVDNLRPVLLILGFAVSIST